MPRFLCTSLATLAFLAFTGPAVAQQQADDHPLSEAAKGDEGSWYAAPSVVQMTPRMIIQEKAQTRAYQRIARIESMKWYGMSASRPTTSSTPLMGIPSPRWQMPGGRPFAWTPSRGPSVMVVR